MKLKAGIFLAAFALAAGFGLAAGAALSSEADEPHFKGELLSGSREAAGFTLTLDAVFEEHLVLSETYDASSGEGSSRGARRSPEPLRLHEDSAEPALEYPSLFLTLNYYWDFGEPLPEVGAASLPDAAPAGPVSAALASAACEDGLLYTLEHISWPKGSPEGGFAYAHRLAAFDGEGNCLYCEQLSHPLTDYFNRPPSSGAGEFRLTGPERS